MNFFQNNSELPLRKMPLWKWMLELVFGFIILFVLYVAAQMEEGIGIMALEFVTLPLSAAALIALFLVWTKWFEGTWRKDLLNRSVIKHLTTGMMIGVVYFIALTAILIALGCAECRYASPNWTYIMLSFVVYFLVACGEEVLFRGIIFRMIDERYGKWWALGISALIFGFMHLVCDNSSIWSSVAIAIEAGVLLGAAFKSSGSLWLPIGIHWTWNFTQGTVFGFAVSGDASEAAIFSSTVSGSDLITGGAFGPEASIVAMVLGALISLKFIIHE